MALVGDGYTWSKTISTSYEKPGYYTISDDNRTVQKTSNGGSIYNVVATPARTVGTLVFAVKVMSTSTSDQYNTIGLKDTQVGHLRSSGLSMRLDNGQIYQKGSWTKLALRPVMKGDVVTVRMDMATDSVTFRIQGEAPVTHKWTGRRDAVRPSVAARATGWEFHLEDPDPCPAMATAAAAAAAAAWAAFEAAEPEKAAAEKVARGRAAAEAAIAATAAAVSVAMLAVSVDECVLGSLATHMAASAIDFNRIPNMPQASAIDLIAYRIFHRPVRSILIAYRICHRPVRLI